MISAGEVVERPASVVKELVENSIDAGATEISVTIEEGGIRRICVSDDGTGVLKEDMRAAFLPHATSKLSEITDLDTISTLGFRGEALASIASVSEVTMVSRADGSTEANKLALSGGKVTEECVSSRAKGTSVTVENLFFNSFIVYALPEPVVRMDFEHFLSELFSHMLDDGELKLSDLMKETVCRDACRAAIKGGEHLTKRQIEQVLANFLNDKGELPQKCPHGRPAVVALTRRDFEKMFLRIV